MTFMVGLGASTASATQWLDVEQPELATADELVAWVDSVVSQHEPKVRRGKLLRDPELAASVILTWMNVDQFLLQQVRYPKSWEQAAREQARARIQERYQAEAERHADLLGAIVERQGWVTRDVHGERASYAAWLLVQHADHAPDFQVAMLERMAPLLGTGRIEDYTYAYLYDRVQTNRDALQRYATQGRCADGTWQPFELEAPERVEELRKEVGLEPLEVYAARFGCRK